MRSLSYLLTDFDNIRQVFVAPPQLQVPADVLAILDEKGVKYEVSDDLRAAVKVSDAVYMTRIQDEWDQSKGESARIDTHLFKFGVEELALLPSLGEKRAKAIVEYREEHSKFENVEDIKNVKGIGESIFEEIKDKICV